MLERLRKQLLKLPVIKKSVEDYRWRQEKETGGGVNQNIDTKTNRPKIILDLAGGTGAWKGGYINIWLKG